MAGTLYLVATPIGNLGDLSPRGADTLAQVDFIAAEDTRGTGTLLHHLGLKKPMVSYHRHSGQGRSDELVARLLGGEDCALVTDAGTPAISDPGRSWWPSALSRGSPWWPSPGPAPSSMPWQCPACPRGGLPLRAFSP